MGAVKNTPVLNASRLVPGVVVANNVVASTHREAAILFSGDPSAGLAAPVPYGRIVNNTIHGGVTVNVNGTTIANSSVVTVPRTDGMWAGMVVTGTGIPADTRIASIDSSTQVTLTRPATAAGTGVALTFAFRTVGVQVTDNAAPTLLNNVFASLATGIEVDATSAAGTVVGFSAFSDTKTVGVAGQNAVTLATDPFVNAARGNFYPVAKAPIIDTALDVLQDRPAYVAVTQPLGLPQSPIIAPSRDLFGQLRSDDPGQASPPGLGSNVFKDLGAVDRVDFVQPWLTLADPLDQGLTDGDPAVNSVSLSGSAATGMAKFILQLNDSGVGIDKTTVVKQAFTIVRDGTTLVEGTDYVFRYLESTNRVVFESPSAFALGEYEIRATTRPATSGQDGYLTDLANNTLLNNNPNGSTTFTVSLIGLPSPTNLAAAFGDGSVDLTWTAPDAPVDAPISDYVVQYRTDVVGSSWQTFNDGVGTAAATTVTGLTNGTAYRFRVAAVNNFGTGKYSTEVTETPRAVPAAPTNLSGTAGNAQVALSWTVPGNNGGAAITDYVVEYKTTAALTWTTFPDGTSTGTTATVTGLTNGTDYLFRVSAVNSVGTGTASAVAGPYTPAMPASAPTGLLATFGNGSVGLSWTVPSSNGGAAITDYVVEYKTTVAATWTVFADGTSTTTSATVTGLTNGIAYMFRVAANNSVGLGAYSNEVTETPRAAPSAPSGLAGVVGNAQVALSWNVPAANGATITDYVVEYKTTAAATWSTFADGTSTTASATVTGLTNGTAYLFRVSAVNSVGTGAASAEAGPLTPRTVPGVPTALLGTPRNGQVGLTWTVPGTDGGSAITDYVVEYRTNLVGSSWATFPDGTGTGTSATVTGLTNGTAYLFRVSATNAAGTGSVSAEAGPITPRTVPGQVTNVVATGANGRIEVTWNPPGSNGGAAITDYLVNYSTSPTGPFVLFKDGVSTATSAAITGLTNGVTYYVRVRAVNAAGNSAPTQAGPVVPFVQAAAPTGLTGTVGNGRVNLTWTAGTSPKPITDYVIQFRTDVAGSSWTTFTDAVSAATTASVTGLTNGTRYLFRVAAVNADGVGVFTDGTLGLTPVVLPAVAPTAVTGRGSAGVITLNWVAAPSSVQSPVTGYVIQYRANSSTAKWTTLPLTVGNVTTARITTLTSRLGYFFRVAARNASGQGPWSAASALIRPY
jgi:titin